MNKQLLESLYCDSPSAQCDFIHTLPTNVVSSKAALHDLPSRSL